MARLEIYNKYNNELLLTQSIEMVKNEEGYWTGTTQDGRLFEFFGETSDALTQ